MKANNQRVLWIIGLLLCALVGLVLFFASATSNISAVQSGTRVLYTKIAVAGNAVRVTIADAPDTRAQGLGGRTGLAPDEGMLFVFEKPAKHSFWMKDMQFPIDILWVGADKRVVHIQEQLSPDTYPASFSPSAPALYVLELPAGYATNHGVYVGSQLVF